MFVHAWEQVLSLRRFSTTPSNKYSILNIVYDILRWANFSPCKCEGTDTPVIFL